MKKNYAPLILSILLISCLAQPQRKEWRQVDGQRIPDPPAGIWLKGNLFMDSTEVSNIHWLEFLQYMREEDKASAFKPYHEYLLWTAVQDTAMYLIKESKGYSAIEGKLSYNMAHSDLRHNPLVGVSYEQALAFSEWRSRIVTDLMNEQLEEDGEELRVLLRYRLPTEQEWKLAAQTAYRNASRKRFKKWEGSSLNRSMKAFSDDYEVNWSRIQRQEPTVICQYPALDAVGERRILMQGLNIASSIRMGTPSPKGYYHLIGNVAEMLATRGKAKGGSWMHRSGDCGINSVQNYRCPSEWLGFRNICEVYIYHKDSEPPVLEPISFDSEPRCEWVEKVDRARE